MATECEPTKQRRYDLSMSRRTRKPPTTTSTTKSSQDEDEDLQKKSNNGFHHVSLKELMKESNGEKAESRTGQGNGDGMKLMETAAEKNLPIVRKQGEGIEGVKMAGLVSRYAKVLNHLIKVKRSSKKKNVVQFLM
uniref:Uncharacterized protein LOC105055395 n=2 Tax=Elaeis guineensis var. tenera TaxID=51953 RepID=A0A6I9S1H1_ELAGV|nr:uncharacterized protein LOC105055395 [Elaeis guineensis]